MNNKQQQTANESPQTLWSLLNDDGGVSLPYNGSSGWSGTDTSKERAYIADTNGETKKRQLTTIGHLFNTEENGLTWKELSLLTGWHHGSASGSLSVLHKAGRIARLTEKRMNCRVYVLPEFVIGRETDKQGRKHECPECGHRF